MGQLANRMQDTVYVFRCALIVPEGGSIWDLYYGCYLGYMPNQDIYCTKLKVINSMHPMCMLCNKHPEGIAAIDTNLTITNSYIM